MEKPQLILEITYSRMSAHALEQEQLTLLAEELCTSRSDAGYRQTLTDLIAKCGNMERFDSYSCSFSHKSCTLVPMALFAEAAPEDFLNLAIHNDSSKNETDYNRLPEWSLVNVFYMPMWIKNVLVPKIPRIVIQHELSHILRFLNTGSLVPLRTQIVLHDNHFSCIMRRNGNIVLSGYHDYQSAEDVLYHLLYTVEQEKIDSKGEIFVHTSTDNAFQTAENLRQLAKTIENLKDQKITTHRNEHLLFQKLCV